MSQDAQRVVEQTTREHWGYLYACLVKHLNDFDLAEDVLQESILTALESWPSKGIPESPRAWLLQTAKNKAIDRLRRKANFESKQESIGLFNEQHAAEPDSPEKLVDQMIEDERLRLIFTCCHPALSESAQIALTLRTLGGLEVSQIARAFLVPETTLAQRLVCAKAKISKAGIPYKVPDSTQWPTRIHSVLAVIYLIFNEGHSAAERDDSGNTDLCEEAIRLASMLHQLTPNEPEVMGLLALTLLHDSRRDSRIGPKQEYRPLSDQDRSLWDNEKAEAGRQLLKQALQLGKIGAYQLQAAISAVHSDAPDFESTDWTQIRLLYQRLYELNPTVVIHLNAMVALSFEKDAETALSAMDAIDFSSLEKYQPYYATLADLYRRSEQLLAASKAYGQAISLSNNNAEKSYLENQLAKIQKQLS